VGDWWCGRGVQGPSMSVCQTHVIMGVGGGSDLVWVTEWR